MGKVDLIDDETLAICVAYEQGYGHGLENRIELSNPYSLCSRAPLSLQRYALLRQCKMAWDYGFSAGQNKFEKWKGVSTETIQGDEHLLEDEQ